MQTTLIFDNSAASGSLLSPLTDLRPVFDVRTGAMTTLERITLQAQLNDLSRPDGLIVPEALVPLAKETCNLPVHSVSDAANLAENVFLINGVCPLADTDMTGVEIGRAILDETSGVLVKAHVPASQVAAVLAGDLSGLKTARGTHPTLTRPWHVRTHRDACLTRDLHLLLAYKTDVALREVSPHLCRTWVSPSATVHSSVIIDDERGCVIVDDHATVRPGAIIIGPAYIGEHSTVLERTLIKANTAIGPHCKVAGEIGGTIFQGFANKAHDGHLGDSWVGEWVNLGAGTTNSNLLNTYGEVKAAALMNVGSGKSEGGAWKAAPIELSGEQFLGAILGDHVKTAICTRIMTGAVIGTGTMFAASSPLSGTVMPFSWITDAGTKAFVMDKFFEFARAVMGRRKVVPGDVYLSRLCALAKS
jgi:UDP-N-acetylglucosamine diphosphorylase / glucose-1-phosphate thymidylyltransferase / UDP-N-acetylgalactosamine diphosphorylase / glucosamine-1-phosphate N-acetyltransferase / galactosamine-1-phosphate N-acetyltransferase